MTPRGTPAQASTAELWHRCIVTIEAARSAHAESALVLEHQRLWLARFKATRTRVALPANPAPPVHEKG
jgi:hypothetical protein